MTAQVAVMNRLGIALASDSAVTASWDQDDETKIYSSSDKLFQLSEVAPVAIMISGNSRFLEMPWETVIKVYRGQLGGKTFAKLHGYAIDFFRFVQTNTKMFPQSARSEFVEQLIGALLHDVRNVAHERWEEDDASEDESGEIMSAIIHEVAAEKLKAVKKFAKFAEFDAAMDHAFRTKYGKLIAKKGKKFFKESLPARTHRVLNELIAQSLSSTNFHFMRSGIVFAGFGESDYMPAHLEYAVEGMAQKNLRYFLTDNQQISSQTPGWIEPFGHWDVVNAFIDGVSTEFRSYMEEKIGNFVDDAKDAFVRVSGHDYTDREAEELTAILRKKWEDLSEQWNEGAGESWRPIFRAVASLPKSELADAAENLVNLTKFRLRVSSDEAETVGGPIDVAIITKGDGFVWIKKKQYYPAELNPHKTGQPV